MDSAHLGGGFSSFSSAGFARWEINRWQDSHYATPKVSQELRDMQGEAWAIQKGAADQRNPRP